MYMFYYSFIYSLFALIILSFLFHCFYCCFLFSFRLFKLNAINFALTICVRFERLVVAGSQYARN